MMIRTATQEYLRIAKNSGMKQAEKANALAE